MSAASNKDRMIQFLKLINTLDSAIAHDLISPDIQLQTPIRKEPFCGPEGYIELLSYLRKSFSDIQWTLDEMIAEGDAVACRFTVRGTHTGDFMGFSATNRPIKYNAMNIYHFTDGKIVSEFALPDIMSVLFQIDGIPIEK